MATNSNSNPNPDHWPSLLPEIGPDGLPRENSVIAYTEKYCCLTVLILILKLRYIEENYSKIRDVERELSNLSLEMKLTAGPKKAALEHLRKKIEMSTERIRLGKLKEEEARKAWESASKAVKDEEAIKQKLCEDLNNLVQESSSSQFARLEELKRRLEAMNPNRSSMSVPNDMNSTGTAQSGITQDVSSVPSALEPAGNTLNQGIGQVSNGQNQHPPLDVEGKGKKKIMIQGRGKGIGAVPKGRVSAAPGWTGAGFDVDGRT